MDVRVDNDTNATVDLSSLYEGQSLVVFRSNIMPSGVHTVQLTSLGQNGTYSTNGQDVSVAGFYIQTQGVVGVSCSDAVECLL